MTRGNIFNFILAKVMYNYNILTKYKNKNSVTKYNWLETEYIKDNARYKNFVTTLI